MNNAFNDLSKLNLTLYFMILLHKSILKDTILVFMQTIHKTPRIELK